MRGRIGNMLCVWRRELVCRRRKHRDARMQLHDRLRVDGERELGLRWQRWILLDVPARRVVRWRRRTARAMPRGNFRQHRRAGYSPLLRALRGGIMVRRRVPQRERHVLRRWAVRQRDWLGHCRLQWGVWPGRLLSSRHGTPDSVPYGVLLRRHRGRRAAAVRRGVLFCGSWRNVLHTMCRRHRCGSYRGPRVHCVRAWDICCNHRCLVVSRHVRTGVVLPIRVK